MAFIKLNTTQIELLTSFFGFLRLRPAVALDRSSGYDFSSFLSFLAISYCPPVLALYLKGFDDTTTTRGPPPFPRSDCATTTPAAHAAPRPTSIKFTSHVNIAHVNTSICSYKMTLQGTFVLAVAVALATCIFCNTGVQATDASLSRFLSWFESNGGLANGVELRDYNSESDNPEQRNVGIVATADVKDLQVSCNCVHPRSPPCLSSSRRAQLNAYLWNHRM